MSSAPHPPRPLRPRAGPRPLRVLRLCSVFTPPPAAVARAARFDAIGGMQNHTGQLTAALDRLGVAQTVVTAWRPGAPRVTRLGDRGRVLRLGVPTRRMRQLWALPAASLLPRLCRDLDLVHAHLGEDLALVPLALAASRLARVPLVLTVHCSLRHTLAGRGARVRLLRAVGGPLEALGEARAARVVVLAEPAARALRGSGLDGRVRVIPSGADPARFDGDPPDPTPALGRPRALFVGRLAPQKGVTTLVRAAASMRSPARLALVGDGPQRGEVERLADRLGIRDRVVLLGARPHAEVPAHMRHADVLVLPSIYEELGSVLVEGLHAGLPIVASRVGGIGTVVRHGRNGLLVPPGDPPALAAALDRVLLDPAGAAAMGEASRAAAGAFAWDALAERVLQVYAEAIATRR